jgi:hypothetical protein
VINKPFQEFDAGEYQSPARHHVQISLANIQENFIVESSRIRIVVRGIFGEFLPLDFLEKFFPTREYCLGPNVRLCVSKGGGWTKAFLVVVLMTGTGFGENSNCLATAGEEPSPTSGSCSFGALGDFLVVGFFGGIVPATENDPLGMCTE